MFIELGIAAVGLLGLHAHNKRKREAAAMGEAQQPPGEVTMLNGPANLAGVSFVQQFKDSIPLRAKADGETERPGKVRTGPTLGSHLFDIQNTVAADQSSYNPSTQTDAQPQEVTTVDPWWGEG